MFRSIFRKSPHTPITHPIIHVLIALYFIQPSKPCFNPLSSPVVHVPSTAALCSP